MATLEADRPADLLRSGLELCRRGEWERGVVCLGRLAEDDRNGDLPGRFYSYLGYGIALCQRRVHEGVRLCEHAVKVEFYQPENYVNLTRAALLAGNRRLAWRAVRDGLAIDPDDAALRSLLRRLGRRRRPILPFLPRGSWLNRLLGHLRHAAKGA